MKFIIIHSWKKNKLNPGKCQYIYYKAETKLCVSICKSDCVHAHSQTKRPTASKFSTESLEKVLEKISKRFFKIIFWRFFFLDFFTSYSFILQFSASILWRVEKSLKIFNITKKQHNYNTQPTNQPGKEEKFQLISNFCNHMLGLSGHYKPYKITQT